jgi:hypothetical protein
LALQLCQMQVKRPSKLGDQKAQGVGAGLNQSADRLAPQVGQPGPHQKPTPYQRRAQWTPIYGDYAERTGGRPERTIDGQEREVEDSTVLLPATWGDLHHCILALPVAWRCPCDEEKPVLVYGRSCPECGSVPRDSVHGKRDGSQRCTTGRQGREWKRIAARKKRGR